MDEPQAALPASAELPAGNQPAWFGLRRKWWVLAVSVPSVALAELAFTVLLFSSTQVLQGIDSDTYGYQWATGPYIVALVVVALLSVRLAQTYGSQRTYLWGALVTALGCLVAAGAGSLPVIVLGRLLLSAKALVLAVTLSQLWLAFPRRKGLATAAYCAAMYGGLFVGAAVGAFLEFQVSWRAIYGVSGLLFLLLAWAGHRVLIRDRPPAPPPLKLNGREVSCLVVALAAAVFLIFRGGYFGWLDSDRVLAACVIGTLAVVGFVWTASHEADPLVNLNLRQFPTLALTLAVISLFSAAVVGMLNTLPAYLSLRGYPSAVAGGLLLGPGLAMALTCLATGLLYGRATAIGVLWAGLALSLAGAGWFVSADLVTSRASLTAMLCLWAVGAGLVLPLALRLTFAGQVPAAVQRLAGVKVALRFAATVIGAFMATLIVQRGTDTAQDHLRQGITAGNVAYRQTVARVERHVMARGSSPALAAEQAGSVVGQWVARNAQLAGQQTGRRYILLLTTLAFAIALFIRFRSEVSILETDLHDLAWGGAFTLLPGRRPAPEQAA